MRVGACTKLPGRILPLILLAWVCPAFAQSPQTPKPHVSPVPRLIVLPPKVVAGNQATLAVLDSQGRLLPGIKVEILGDEIVTTDVTGRAIFTAPAEPGKLTAKIAGLTASASADIVPFEHPAAGTTPPAQAVDPSRAKITSYPRLIEIHDRFTLEGTGFRGAADLNRVYLNEDPCLVLASSPVSLVALPGVHVPVGDTNLRVAVAGADAGRFPVSVVLLEFSGPAEAMNVGTTGKLTVRALGTAAPLLLEIRNGSPAVIQLSKGNVQRVMTSGGEANEAPFEVKFVTGGSYVVTARLVSAETATAAFNSAKKRLN